MISMEKKVYSILTLSSGVLFLLGFLPIAIFANAPWICTVSLGIFGLLSFLYFVLLLRFNLYLPTFYYTFALVLTVPLWFSFGGSQGPMPLTFIPILLLINLFFRGFKRHFFFVILLVWALTLIVLEQLQVSPVFQFTELTPRLTLLTSGTGLFLLLIYAMLRVIMGYYDEEKEKVRIANIELMKKNQELQDLALRDRMTGLFNHQHSLDVLNQECLRASRHNYPLSIIMLDVDFFKRVNDTMGHQAGDKVLIQAAEILRLCSRQVDAIGRYGGEEFIIILPQTPLMGAVDVAERIRREFQRQDFFEDSTKITVSLGVAEYNGEEPELFVEYADKELYLAKESGRNQTRWKMSESA